MTLLSPVRPLSASRLRRCPRNVVNRIRIPALVRSSLPFPPEKAKYHRELEVALDAVERACRLCVDVKKSLLSSEGRVLEKNDQTPVTVADFGVQALISLELSRLFPSIPLVAEEDSTFLRSSSASYHEDKDLAGGYLLDAVLTAVAGKAGCGGKYLTSEVVLGAIDRAGMDALTFDEKPATYWVLDPIDGTRGFLGADDALYVVGLALVVEGDVVLGIMGCPNWKNDSPQDGNHGSMGVESKTQTSERGTIMIAHTGCGTRSCKFSALSGSTTRIHDDWKECSVNPCSLVHEAHFCIPDSETWGSLPLSSVYSSTAEASSIKDERQIVLSQPYCGSLCQYLMVASGRASVFILRAKMQTAIKAWDHAAGMICVHEAGGQVTDWKGNPLDFAVDQESRRIIFPSGGVLVTNGRLHKQIIRLISANSPVI